jgi:hypothetical protein
VATVFVGASVLWVHGIKTIFFAPKKKSEQEEKLQMSEIQPSQDK